MAQVDRPATVWLKTTTEVYRLMRSTGRKVLPHILKDENGRPAKRSTHLRKRSTGPPRLPAGLPSPVFTVSPPRSTGRPGGRGNEGKEKPSSTGRPGRRAGRGQKNFRSPPPGARLKRTRQWGGGVEKLSTNRGHF